MSSYIKTRVTCGRISDSTFDSRLGKNIQQLNGLHSKTINTDRTSIPEENKNVDIKFKVHEVFLVKLSSSTSYARYKGPAFHN